MTDQPKFCEFCRAPLPENANFCESCGQKVRKVEPVEPAAPDPAPEPVDDLALITSQAPPPAPEPEPAPAYKSMTADEIEAAFMPPPASVPPPQPPPPSSFPPPPAPPQARSKLPIILGVAGCLTILCIAAVIVAVVLFARKSASNSEIPARITQIVVMPAEPTKSLPPTIVPQPTEPQPVEQPTGAPTAVLQAPGDDGWPLSIGQSLSESAFSDDFSSAKYDWANVDDETRFWGIQNERYTLHLKVPDHTIWAYLPVEFKPNTVGFDAAVQTGFEQGAYGVMCHYQDKENYHFVSIDPYNNEYSIGYTKNGEFISLMQEMWLEAKNLKEEAHAVNHIDVVCDLDMITLFVNNELEAMTDTTDAKAGDIAIYGETWEETPADGFKVLIDNLYAYKPAQ